MSGNIKDNAKSHEDLKMSCQMSEMHQEEGVGRFAKSAIHVGSKRKRTSYAHGLRRIDFHMDMFPNYKIV